MLFRLLALFSSVLMLGAMVPDTRDAAAAGTCALALVLAVDVSGSVDAEEYTIQMSGLARAFRSKDIAQVIVGDGNRGIYVTLVQWSGNTRQEQILPWTWLADFASIAKFADAIDRRSRAFRIYSTGIGEALSFSGSRFADVPVTCRRRVIDVSGDGPNNEGRPPDAERDALVAEGITINGLAILESEPGLKNYYLRNVIGGAGAFVMTADRFEDYPAAIRRKLLREILPPIVGYVAPQRRGR